MIERTFGWVRDPGKLCNLKRAVSLFDNASAVHKSLATEIIPALVEEEHVRNGLLSALERRPLRLSYEELVGGSSMPRRGAKCDGIMQAAIAGQRRPYIGSWAAGNFLRWAHALGFVLWSDDDDRFEISAAGVRYARASEGSDEEYKVLAKALLSYPPVGRVMTLLKGTLDSKPMTKFEIGRRLGFAGEKGFTTISQEFLARHLELTADSKIRLKMTREWEGDADKHARIICAWLAKLKNPWVRFVKKKIRAPGGEMISLRAYELTAGGFENQKRLVGASSAARTVKRVFYEMLCAGGPARSFLRGRRARILQAIEKRPCTIEFLDEMLREEGFASPRGAIDADLKGLVNIGLDIKKTRDGYRCLDALCGLKIPPASKARAGGQAGESDRWILDLMDEYRARLRAVPRDFLVLVQLAFDGLQSRIFKEKIIELLTEHCKLDGFCLGGPHCPDGIVFADNCGIIIDTKAAVQGFNLPVAERDKMFRYVDDARRRPQNHPARWWRRFPQDTQEFLFLFVSGKFGGKFREHLKALHERAEAFGAMISAGALLLTADALMCEEITFSDFRQLLSCLDEVGLPAREDGALSATAEMLRANG